MRRFYFALVITLVLTSSIFSQSKEGPENFRVELTAGAWLTGPTGTIQASGTPINFVTDLAAGAQQPRFYGKFVFKTGRKHRLFVEGSPVSFSGLNVINRSFVFLNKTYDVSRTVSTNASVNYGFAGYQYDPLSGQFGHLGLHVGVAYLGVSGTLNGQQTGISATKNFTAPLPLIGAEGRLFPIPHHKIIQVEAMMRGVPLASYGYFIEGGASAGLRLGPISVLAGYREMLADVHQNNLLGNGVALRLKGPIFSLQGQW